MGSGHRRLLPEEMYPAGEVGASARFITVSSGLRLRVVEAGDEHAQAVVLVPGWGCGAWVYHETLSSLASAGFHAIAVELKGHGLSDKPRDASEYSLESMSAHLIEVLDALSQDRACLVGHSMGAAIVARVGVTRPDRVERIVLVAPIGFAGVPGMSLFRALTPSFAIGVLPVLATRALVALMLRVVFGSLNRASSRDVDEFWAPTRSRDFPRALRHLLHHFSWEEEFREPVVPWMTIFGSEDRLSPAADAARYAGPGGRGKTLVIDGAGHVILEEAPETAGRAIAEFFGAEARTYIEST